MTITEVTQRELVRRLTSLAVTLDRLPAEDDRDWLDQPRRSQRRDSDHAEARRQLRELRDRLAAMPLEE